MTHNLLWLNPIKGRNQKEEPVYSDEKILEGIRKKDRGVIHFVYSKYFASIRSLVDKNSGSIQDAEDLFQDGLVALYQRCRSRELNLNCSLKSYFYAICQNLWLQRLERKFRIVYYANMYINDHQEKYVGREGLTKENKLERHRLFYVHFERLPEDCKKILTMHMDKIPYKKVAEILGYTNDSYAKVRKYVCVNRLKNWIVNDPDFPNCFPYDK